jgi:hemerythrin-like domain-containing protein
MNIIELLKEQHRQVRGIFGRIVVEDRKQHRSTLADLSKALRAHLQIEEKIVYPAAQKAFQGDEENEQRMLVSYEEHASARRALEELERTSPLDKRFGARARVLSELVDHHIEEEESETFPEMRARMSEVVLAKLGDLVERRLSAIESEAEQPSPRAKRAVGQARRAAATPRARGGSTSPRARGGARGASGRARPMKTSGQAPGRTPGGSSRAR